MSSQLSNQAQTLALNFLFNNQSATRPTSWYIGLSTTTPSTSGGNVTEPIGAGYTRKAATFSASSGNPASTSNSNTMTFTASGGDWGTITYITIYDSDTGGTPLAIGQLTNAKLIQNGDSLQFGAVAISITLQ